MLQYDASVEQSDERGKFVVLTVAFGSVLQAERNGQHGVIFKELCGERVPPEVVTLLSEVEGREKLSPTQLLDCDGVHECKHVSTNLCPVLQPFVEFKYSVVCLVAIWCVPPDSQQIYREEEETKAEQRKEMSV